MPAVEPSVAREVAAAIGGKLYEMFRVRDHTLVIVVPRALQLKLVAEVASLLHEVDDLSPHWNMDGSLRVADDVHPVPGSGQQHIDTI